MGETRTGQPPGAGTTTANLTAEPEKFLDDFRATSGQYAAADHHLMIQGRVIDDLKNRTNGAGLRIIGAIHQPSKARVHGRAGAHRAGLDGDKQIAVDDTVISNVTPCLAQGHDFGVGSGIVLTDVAVPTSAYDTPGADDDSSHWHFADIERALGTAQGFVHPQFVRRKFFRRTLVRGGQLFVTEGGLPHSLF